MLKVPGKFMNIIFFRFTFTLLAHSFFFLFDKSLWTWQTPDPFTVVISSRMPILGEGNKTRILTPKTYSPVKRGGWRAGNPPLSSPSGSKKGERSLVSANLRVEAVRCMCQAMPQGPRREHG